MIDVIILAMPTSAPAGVAGSAAGSIGSSARSPAVSARDLKISYGGHVALRQTQFTIPRAALTVLIGSNGSGKSTLMNAVAGLIAPARGSLSVLGRPGPGSPDSVAYVLQATEAESLLPVTVREIVTMGRFATRGLFGRLGNDDRRVVDAAIAATELEPIADRRFSALSVGQRQRALVAQGLAQRSEILLLDEPMTGLDIVSRQRILDVVDAERAAGRAVVMASHDLADARTADHVILLAGRVVAEGTPSETLTAEYLREAYGHRYLELDDPVGIVDDHHHHG